MWSLADSTNFDKIRHNEPKISLCGEITILALFWTWMLVCGTLHNYIIRDYPLVQPTKNTGSEKPDNQCKQATKEWRLKREKFR